MADRFLPGVPGPKIEALLNKARGNEIATGKFDSPRSSAALAANTFGYFLERPEELPPLPGRGEGVWPARSVDIERTVRFPWRGGTPPHLDVLVTTQSALIGIESKRYEPFDRGKKAAFRSILAATLGRPHEALRERQRQAPRRRASLRLSRCGPTRQTRLWPADGGPPRRRAPGPHAGPLLPLR